MAGKPCQRVGAAGVATAHDERGRRARLAEVHEDALLLLWVLHLVKRVEHDTCEIVDAQVGIAARVERLLDSRVLDVGQEARHVVHHTVAANGVRELRQRVLCA